MNKWLRDTHRWLSIAFTLAAIANIVALVEKVQAVWIGLVALIPLILLLLSGLYLFALPYVTKSRSGNQRESLTVGLNG
jgi:hypothetical protein